jgi:hypothetical protein
MKQQTKIIIGVILTMWGFIGGWEMLSELTGMPWFNVVTKDQITVVIGLTWLWMNL